MSPTEIGTGVGGFLLAVWVAFRKARKASRVERPLFENGEKAKLERLLARLDTDSRDHLKRILQLEADSDEGNREHDRLGDRLMRLERRFAALQEKPPD